MKNGSGRRGYSLIELILAMALFVSLSGGLGYAIIRGVRAHAFEASFREATLQTRTMLDQMTEELRSASIPDDIKALSSNEVSIASAVWIPNPYGTTSDTSGFYAVNTSSYVHSSRNRLVFTRKDPSDNSGKKYVFVEWIVPSGYRNRMYRIVHQLDLSSPPYTCTSSKYSITDADYLSNGSTSFGKNLLFSDTGKQGTGKTSEYIVAQLPGENDRFCFAVEHDDNKSEYKGRIGGREVADKNGAKYNPSLFRVHIKATIYNTYLGADNKKNDVTANTSVTGEDNNPYITESDSQNKRVVVYSEQVHILH